MGRAERQSAPFSYPTEIHRESQAHDLLRVPRGHEPSVHGLFSGLWLVRRDHETRAHVGLYFRTQVTVNIEPASRCTVTIPEHQHQGASRGRYACSLCACELPPEERRGRDAPASEEDATSRAKLFPWSPIHGRRCFSEPPVVGTMAALNVTAHEISGTNAILTIVAK